MSTTMSFKEQQRAGGFDTAGIEQLRLAALSSATMEEFIKQIKSL